MRRSLSYSLAFFAPLLLALVLVAAQGEARPGGGNTYRGSSSSSSSGSRGFSSSSSSSHSYSSSSSGSHSSSSGSYSGSSSSGSGSSVGGAFGGLCFLLMMVMIIMAVVASAQRSQKQGKDWSTAAPPPRPVDVVGFAPGARPVSARKLLERLRTAGPPGPDGRPVPFDPDFSLVPFEDFLYALYAKAHEARGGGRVDTLAAYLSQGARQTLSGISQPVHVKAVVVGSMQYLDATNLRPDSQTVSVRIRFEANYTEVSTNGFEQSFYVAEEWTLSRSTAAKSRPPDAARVFKCPNCGAPLEGMRGNTCSYCEKKVDTGEFDWVVATVELQEREARGPQLGGDTPEEGTDLPTVKQPRVNEHLGALLEQDPELSWNALAGRLVLIFQELQVAWSNRQWEHARPYVSDSLFQMQLYWMEAYKQAGLRNVTEKARITRVELARVVGDKYYHAITVRLFATGLDYTVRDSDGHVVGGSKSRERQYSEYWTLIRGTSAKGRPRTDKHCPSCGAPLAINLAGNCTHCSARVSSGDFDWVLSRIEQDESYQG
ncbi:MAG: TIM44-like domain-containing protein [Hyalangium sp.]|uniref:TIM44-like domain-containing protein n=1 Tax=Hyalangium sp. TaxID=2028555 RepID=UPI00389995B6